MKFYDKILFLIGVLMLLAGVFYYTSSSASVSSTLPPRLTVPPSGEDYIPIRVPEISGDTVEWLEPAAQSHGPLWVYDVFTPPKIYFNEDTNEFLPEPPRPPAPPPPFGIQLVEVVQKLYRLQFDGYLDAPSGKPQDAILLFRNTESSSRPRLSVGMRDAEGEFSVLSFELRRDDSGGLLRRIPIVTIRDERIGRDVVLRSDEKLVLPDQIIAILQGTEPNFPRFEIPGTGGTITIGDATFIVSNIRFDNQSATVEKQQPDMEEPEIRELQAQGEVSTTAPGRNQPRAPVRPASPQEVDDNIFRGLFD